MARRSYTPDEKADALAAYVEHGPQEAATVTGIPKSTIASWARRAGVHTRSIENAAARVKAQHVAWEERRLRLAHDIGQTAEMALEVTRLNIAAGMVRDAKDAATTMAILVDKAQLLTGSATARTEVVAVDAVDAEIAALTEALAANDPQPVDA